MKRRDLLKGALAIPTFRACAYIEPNSLYPALPTAHSSINLSRVRPGEPGWPSEEKWIRLKQQLKGSLERPVSPFAKCSSAHLPSCQEASLRIRNPYFIGDEPALTQTSGWVDAWGSQPSVYAVRAGDVHDVVAAVNFARENRLRLVVRGGGHSYHGASEAANSLLVWTRGMNQVEIHRAFVAHGCEAVLAPQPAVSIGAGAMWSDAYHHVTTLDGRYVQGGGCMTVGVPGLVQSGGFSSFSKRYGTAAAGLLEAEIVTADGKVRVVNERNSPDLFWALKGGGGGVFGVVTRVTLRTRELPEYFGAVVGTVRAHTETTFRELIAKFVDFYADALFNPHWGERFAFGKDTLQLTMLYQDLTTDRVHEIWDPFLEWVRSQPVYEYKENPRFLRFPACHFWDCNYLREHHPEIKMIADDRAGAPAYHAAYAEDEGEIGWFIHGYDSVWLSASLLAMNRRHELADALFACTRFWSVKVFVSKGLAGAPEADVAAARNTAMNPAVTEAFALAIVAGGSGPAYTGMPGSSPDLAKARDDAHKIAAAIGELHKIAPKGGSYLSESGYFLDGWQEAFWGANYPALAATKKKYDPNNLFFVRHGVGSEGWSEDGFVRLEATGSV